MSTCRQAYRRLTAAALLPLLLAAGTAHGYALAVCRHDHQVRALHACCQAARHPTTAAAPREALSRGCCDARRVSIESPLASQPRRPSLDLPTAPVALTAWGSLPPDELLGRRPPLPSALATRAAGPPVILLTCSRLV